MKRAIIIVIDNMLNETWSQELNRMMKYTIEYEDGNWVAHIEEKAGEQKGREMTVTDYCTGSCEECMKDAPYEYCCKLECGEHEFCRRCQKADCCSLIIPMNGIDKGWKE